MWGRSFFLHDLAGGSLPSGTVSLTTASSPAKSTFLSKNNQGTERKE